MESISLIFFVLAVVVHIQMFKVDAASCLSKNKPCLWEESPKTQTLCNQKLFCSWCPTQANAQKLCQTVNFECLLASTWDLTASNAAECTTAASLGTGIFCDGDQNIKCIYSDKIYKICFKPSNVIPCATTYATKQACQLNNCVWCDANNGLSTRVNKCWEMAASAACAAVGDCCLNRRILNGDNPDASTCQNEGGHICTDDDTGLTLCNIGPGPGVDACPTGNVELCPGGTNQQLCEALCCTWCVDDNAVVCKRETFGLTCDDTSTVCPTLGLANLAACRLHGCDWCGQGTGATQCIASTECASCHCPNPKECCGITEAACLSNGCLWCSETTSARSFNCMLVDSGGLPTGDTTTYTECSRTCGSGTKWKNVNCVTSSSLTCREYVTCNAQACETEVCDHGEIMRYGDKTGSCCLNQTGACGINNLNNPGGATPSSSRKKRVVGGVDVLSNKKWPWTARVFSNDMNCTGTLISDEYVITSRVCTNVFAAASLTVSLGDYDLDNAPIMQYQVIEKTEEGDITLLKLNQTVEFSSCASPLCMPNGENITEGWMCVIVGWGQTVDGDPTSKSQLLLDAPVCVSPWDLCAATWPTETVFVTLDETKHLCASRLEGGKDECEGDLGGPLMCQRCENCGWFLAGVATDKVGCGVPFEPTLFARVDYYEKFIATKVDPLDPGVYESC